MAPKPMCLLRVSIVIAASAMPIWISVIACAQRWWTCIDGLALLLGLLAGRVELLRLGHDLVLLLLVALDLRAVLRLLLAAGERGAELREVLLAALRLVEVPLVRRFGLPDRGFVLVQQRVVLRRAGHVSEQRADRREDRGHDGDAAGERVAGMRGMLDLVVVRTVHVEVRLRTCVSSSVVRKAVRFAAGERRDRKSRTRSRTRPGLRPHALRAPFRASRRRRTPGTACRPRSRGRSRSG